MQNDNVVYVVSKKLANGRHTKISPELGLKLI